MVCNGSQNKSSVRPLQPFIVAAGTLNGTDRERALERMMVIIASAVWC
jgi:hypothetical protein